MSINALNDFPVLENIFIKENPVFEGKTNPVYQYYIPPMTW